MTKTAFLTLTAFFSLFLSPFELFAVEQTEGEAGKGAEGVCASDSFLAVSDLKTGVTLEIRDPHDPAGMNWIDSNPVWGTVDGFEVHSVKAEGGKILVSARNSSENLSLTIEKFVEGERYTERFCVTNDGPAARTLSHDNLGIHFPYNCNFKGRPNLLETSCVTHLWCGGDASWLYSAKPDGSRPFLVCWVTEGGLGDYSIFYDCSRTQNGSHYRGVLVLHPTPCSLAPGESKSWTFAYSFTDRKPDECLPDFPTALRAAAENYSVYSGETISGTLETAFEWESAEILAVGTENPESEVAPSAPKTISYEKNGNSAHWSCVFETPGEREIQFRVGGKKTFLRVNVLEPLETILAKRARFIAEKQQVCEKGSPLDGAYLIFDRETERTYCLSFADSNAARERLSMGVIVAIALQKQMDPVLMDSLKRHRTFVERELFDEETGTVFNDIGRNNQLNRAYNYPWMADYWFEWYRLTKERQCLENAAGTLLAYYRLIDGIPQESPCLEPVQVHQCLAAEKMDALAAELKDAVLRHAELILKSGNAFYSGEVSCTQGMFHQKIISLCHAYLLSGDPKYLKLLPGFLAGAEAFCGQQPDFRMNCAGVRYWDLYWFGKMKTFGDTMPQWLNALYGEMNLLLSRLNLCEPAERARTADRVFRNSLCLFCPDGFAASSYLVPYRVTQFCPPNAKISPSFQPQTTFGQCYDDWANDQDWILYYAVRAQRPLDVSVPKKP